MMGRSHLVTGVAVATAAASFAGPPNPAHLALGSLAAGVGVLLPDVDRRGLGHWLFRGHRKLTHTGLALIIITLAALLAGLLALVPWWAAGPFAVGYAAHLAGDSLTRSGIPFGYFPAGDPAHRWDVVHSLPYRLRISTGGKRRAHPRWWQSPRGAPVGEWAVMFVTAAAAAAVCWSQWR